MFGLDKNLVNAIVVFNHVFAGSLIFIAGLLSFYFIGIPVNNIFNLNIKGKLESTEW